MIIHKVYRRHDFHPRDYFGRLKSWTLRLFLFVCAVIALELCMSMRYLSTTRIRYGKNGQRHLSRDPTHNFSLVDDLRLQFEANCVVVNDSVCFRKGLAATVVSNSTMACQCKSGWHGPACSIPGIVLQSSKPFSVTDITLRRRPRRIIQAFPFNMEFEILELRFAELSNVVDVFLILESNYTAFGTSKPLYLLDRLTGGMYADVLQKVVHVTLDYFPADARKDGWIADGLHRNFMGTHGLSKISGLNSSDIFVMTDADELPKNDVLSFLKWHDGYTEPIAISYQWNVFGFFWSPAPVESQGVAGKVASPRTQEVFTVATIGMVRYVFRNMVYGIRSAGKVIENSPNLVQIYSKLGGRVSTWTIGNETVSAGWHCSWCMGLNRIRNKLLSAQNGDFPRWGDYPNKTKVSFIRDLVARGMWFDERTSFNKVNVSGPESLFKHHLKFKHIMHNDYVIN